MEDIKNLRNGISGQPAPIEYQRGKGFRYTDSSFNLQQGDLDAEDLFTLLDLVDWIKQLTYGQLPAGFSETIHNLAKKVHNHVNPKTTSVQLDRPGGLDGSENMPSLHRAILGRTVIRITYHEYLSDPATLTLSPFLLKEYNRRWFLVAFDHHAKRLWTFPLDRITAVTELQLTKFQHPPGIDPRSWLDPIIGVIRPPDVAPLQIRLRTTPLQACYLKTKPLHHTQQEVTPAGASSPEFTLRVIPNPELEMQLLSLGSAVEVLAPASLRQTLANRLKAALQHYRET